MITNQRAYRRYVNPYLVASFSGNGMIVGFMNACMFLFLALIVVFLFPSGYPQINDGFMVLGLMAMLFYALHKKGWGVQKAFFAAIMFGTVTFVINLIYLMFYKDIRLLLSSMYYIYNAGIFIFTASLIKKSPEQTSFAIYMGIAFSLLAELYVCVAMPEFRNGRIIGTFNNPNQLANWSLACAAILLILKKHRRLNIVDFGLLLVVAYIQTMALSKAGIICVLLIFMSLPFTKMMSPFLRTLSFFFAVILFIFSLQSMITLYEKIQQVEFLDRSVSRLENIGQEGDDSLEGRKYDRFIKYPQYLLTGAGEGAFHRFSEGYKPSEMHSGVGNILFSYGIIGFCVFLYFLYTVSQKNDKYFLYILFVLMLYGLTHQNIRDSHFWVFLGVAYSARYIVQAEREKNENLQAVYT